MRWRRGCCATGRCGWTESSGRRATDSRRAPSSPPSFPIPRPVSRQSPCRCRSCTRTSIFSSSTSRPGSSSIRAQACEEARSSASSSLWAPPADRIRSGPASSIVSIATHRASSLRRAPRPPTTRCRRRSDIGTSNDGISHSSAARRGRARVESRRRSAATGGIPRGARSTPTSPAMPLRTSRSSSS